MSKPMVPVEIHRAGTNLLLTQKFLVLVCVHVVFTIQVVRRHAWQQRSGVLGT